MLNYSYRALLKVAIPLMASTFIQSIVLITDSSFLSRYDTLTFDAAGNGGLIFITMYMVLVGMNEGSQILMARRIGEAKTSLLPKIFGSSLLISSILAFILLTITWLILPEFIIENTRDATIGQMQIDYLQIRSFGLLPSVISLAIIAYFVSNGKTLVVLVSAALIAVTNIGLDYALIFGRFGSQEMGLEGAALASTLSDVIGCLFLIASLFFSKSAINHKLLQQLSVRKESLLQLIKVGTPLMLQGTLALLTWTIFFFWIEQIGVFELTVSQNIRSLYFLAFVPILGFGAATKTYISQYIGTKNHDALPIIMRRMQLLTVLFLLILFHGAILYPEKLIALINPAQEFIEKSASILRFIFCSILLYGFVSIYFYSIAGSGNTRYIFIIEIIAVLIYLLFAYLFIKVLALDIYWIWSVEYIYFGIIGILSVLYLKLFNWKNKQL
ncbi:MAG: MATE family multidrug resistance protein [Flavobacteriaceae bacterium]|jgi:MATE family multidrug resistance protein